MPSGTRYPEGVSFPVTAFFRFDGTLADLPSRRVGELEFYNPLAIQNVAVRGHTIPLQTNLTTPLAYMLSGTGLDYVGYYGFFAPEKVQSQQGIYMLEPYQPGKIPVLMIHGLLSSPITWAPLLQRPAGRSPIARALPVLVLLLSDRQPLPGNGGGPAPRLAAPAPGGRSPASGCLV